jgi:hypothetical protein
MSLKNQNANNRRTKGSSNTVLDYQRSRLESRQETPISKRVNDEFYLTNKNNKFKNLSVI